MTEAVVELLAVREGRAEVDTESTVVFSRLGTTGAYVGISVEVGAGAGVGAEGFTVERGFSGTSTDFFAASADLRADLWLGWDGFVELWPFLEVEVVVVASGEGGGGVGAAVGFRLISQVMKRLINAPLPLKMAAVLLKTNTRHAARER